MGSNLEEFLAGFFSLIAFAAIGETILWALGRGIPSLKAAFWFPGLTQIVYAVPLLAFFWRCRQGIAIWGVAFAAAGIMLLNGLGYFVLSLMGSAIK